MKEYNFDDKEMYKEYSDKVLDVIGNTSITKYKLSCKLNVHDSTVTCLLLYMFRDGLISVFRKNSRIYYKKV